MKLMIELDDSIMERIKAKDVPLSKFDDICRVIENGTLIADKDEKSTGELINEIAGFDVSLMPKLPEYEEPEVEVQCARCIHFEDADLYNSPCDGCKGKRFKAREEGPYAGSN